MPPSPPPEVKRTAREKKQYDRTKRIESLEREVAHERVLRERLRPELEQIRKLVQKIVADDELTNRKKGVRAELKW